MTTTECRNIKDYRKVEAEKLRTLNSINNMVKVVRGS